MIKHILLLCLISTAIHCTEKEKKPRYTYHTEIRPDGTVYHYAIDHSPEAKAKIDAQFGPLRGYDTSSLGY